MNLGLERIIMNVSSQLPTGEDFLHFAIDLSTRISGYLNGGTVCSRSTIKQCLTELFQHLARDYDDFKMSSKHQELLLSILYNHEVNGLVSTSPNQEKP